MQEALVFDVETLYILIVLNFFRIAFLMAVLDNLEQ